MIELRICRVLALCVFLLLTLSSGLPLATMPPLSRPIVAPNSVRLQLLLSIELIFSFFLRPRVLWVLDLETHFHLLSF